jgi:hypothetical protein
MTTRRDFFTRAFATLACAYCGSGREATAESCTHCGAPPTVADTASGPEQPSGRRVESIARHSDRDVWRFQVFYADGRSDVYRVPK